MNKRLLIPMAALVLSSATLLLHAQQIKKTAVTPTSAASGHEMYTEYCAVCHGTDGKGSGPASAALKTRPADLTMLAVANGGKFPNNKVYAAIRGDAETPAHGSKDMPVWGSVFQEMSRGNSGEVQLRISNLTRYIESMQMK